MAFQFSNSISLVSKGDKIISIPRPSLDLTAIPSLDLTVVNAVWSTHLRISTYTGPCLRLRRSTDNVLADFYADASGNLGTALGATGTSYSSWKGAATTFVHTWYDQSDKNNDITQQSNISAQPIYSSSNGVVFNGTSSHFYTNAYSTTLNTQTFTIISSATSIIADNNKYGSLITSRSGIYPGNLRGYTIYRLPDFVGAPDIANTWYMSVGKNANTWVDLITYVKATINVRYILAFNRSSSQLTSSIKNTSTSAVTDTTVNTDAFSPNLDRPARIGAGSTEETTSKHFFNGYINDLFYFGTSLTTTQQSAITNNL